MEGQKLSRQRDREVELGKSARVVQRAFKVTAIEGEDRFLVERMFLGAR